MRRSVIPLILIIALMFTGGVSAADNSSNTTGDMIAGIPLVDKPEKDVMEIIRESMEVEVDGYAGIIKTL